jgi:hypothetical protein
VAEREATRALWELAVGAVSATGGIFVYGRDVARGGDTEPVVIALFAAALAALICGVMSIRRARALRRWEGLVIQVEPDAITLPASPIASMRTVRVPLAEIALPPDDRLLDVLVHRGRVLPLHVEHWYPSSEIADLLARIHARALAARKGIIDPCALAAIEAQVLADRPTLGAVVSLVEGLPRVHHVVDDLDDYVELVASAHLPDDHRLYVPDDLALDLGDDLSARVVRALAAD